MLLCAFSLFVQPLAAQRVPIEELKRSNSKYAELYEKCLKVSARCDEIAAEIDMCRQALYETSDAVELDSISRLIGRLEEQRRALMHDERITVRQMIDIERDFVSNGGHSSYANEVDDDTFVDVDTAEVRVVYSRNLIENDCFKQYLSESNYAELLAAQQDESVVRQLVDEYLVKYQRIKEVGADYAAADRLSVGDPLYEEYLTIVEELKELETAIVAKWSKIYDVKTFSLSFILDTLHYNQYSREWSRQRNNIEEQCVESAGKYSSDALVRYALEHKQLLKNELEFARVMRIKEAKDSLQEASNNYRQVRYELEPIVIERRELMDFANIEIGRTDYYRTEESLPELRVYPTGTIYRILLGKYRNKPTSISMDQFYGVKPMCYSCGDDNMYYYYAGGYATEQEARDELQYLKSRGFRNPEICKWEDGVMTNISVEERKQVERMVAASEPKVVYVVIIGTSTISSKMHSIISSEAPGKIEQRSGKNYMVGYFKSRNEADSLLTTLAESFPTLEMQVQERLLNK